MRNGRLIVLLLTLAACSRVHSRVETLAPTCTTADRAMLDELQRASHDSARIADLEGARADTATIAALSHILADTARMTDLRRLAPDSAWSDEHQPQVDALLAELARFDRCAR